METKDRAKTKKTEQKKENRPASNLHLQEEINPFEMVGISIWVNKNFLIRCASDENPKKTWLTSAMGYRKMLGDSTANKHFSKLQNIKERSMSIKLRRGLKIDFVGK